MRHVTAINDWPTSRSGPQNLTSLTHSEEKLSAQTSRRASHENNKSPAIALIKLQSHICRLRHATANNDWPTSRYGPHNLTSLTHSEEKLSAQTSRRASHENNKSPAIALIKLQSHICRMRHATANNDWPTSRYGPPNLTSHTHSEE